MKPAKRLLYLAAIIFAATVFIGGAIWWRLFEFQECRKVGHSTAYCVVNR